MLWVVLLSINCKAIICYNANFFFCFELASDMAKLAEEVCGCRVQRLSGGMMGENTAVVLKHLAGGQPVLIPYLYCFICLIGLVLCFLKSFLLFNLI